MKPSFHKTMVNLCAANIRMSKNRMCSDEITEETDKYCLIAENCKAPLLVIDMSSRQKISKNIEDWNSTIIQVQFRDIKCSYKVRVKNL